MKVIEGRNVNEIWDNAKVLLNSDHVVRPSRVGEVMECSTPVTTVYENPTERVLFDPRRNANPYFHFHEALWMIAGRRDVAFLELFQPKISEFVGKGPLLHDAYGYRWRYEFDMDGGAEDGYADQLVKIIRMLKKNPDERRAVLTMWSPQLDLERPDQPSVPCNTQAYFKIRNGRLDMVVTCRSNDICLGCYGANVVHFSYLIEYMAAMIGVAVGTYYQVSDSWHAYTARWEAMGGFDAALTPDYYVLQVEPYPLVGHSDSFDAELQVWLRRDFEALPERNFNNAFFVDVAEPLYASWLAYKSGSLDNALHFAGLCKASDWALAASQWLTRIKQNREKKAAVR